MDVEIQELTREETWQRLLELKAVEGEMPPELTKEEIEGGKRYEVKNKRFPDNTQLAGADLRLFNLSGAKLQGANLSGAWLNDANLSGAELYRANLKGAKLNYADLSGAKLIEADLSGAELWRANLSGAELRNADLSGAELWRANLSGAELRNADLSGAKLIEADLSGAKLWGANLSGAVLYRANLSGAELNGANLSGAELNGANLSGAGLYRANLSGAKLIDAKLISKKAPEETTTNAETGAAQAQEPKPEMLVADISGATFKSADLTRAILYLKDGDREYSVKGIVAEQFGGADLSSAELPPVMKQEQWLDTLADASKNSRNTFLILMALCYFSILLLISPSTTKDGIEFVKLPGVGIELPRETMAWSTPVLLLIIFTYFQFNMQRYWEMLSESPAVFPDGKTYEKHIYPWLANAMAALYFNRLPRKPGFMYPQIIVVALFLWAAVPATLAVFYFYSNKRLPVMLIAFAGVWISAIFAASMDNIMGYGSKKVLIKSPAFWVVNLAVLAIFLSLPLFLL